MKKNISFSGAVKLFLPPPPAKVAGLLIAALFFAAIQMAEAQSINAAVRVCPSSTGNQVSVQNIPTDHSITPWRDNGLTTFNGFNPILGSPSTYTATSTEGRYILSIGYRRTAWGVIGSALGIFNAPFVGSKNKWLSKFVRVVNPAPRVPELAWCSGGTYDITIEGLENNAADCFFNGFYRYVLPSGWTSNCLTDPNRLTCTSGHVTSSKTITVTTPSNLANLL